MNERKIAYTKRTSWRWTCLLVLVLCDALSFVGNAQEPKSGELTVYVSGFTSGRGHAVVNLFRPGEDILKIKHAFQRQRQEITDGRTTFVFKGIPYGEYAISVFHDENDNGELDHLFGLPAEPLGFSNGFRFGLFSGLPSFEKLKFYFSTNGRIIEIKLNH